MALKRLQDSLHLEFDEVAPDNQAVATILSMVDDFINAETKQYEKNKANNALNFGKYRGYTLKELALTDKGKDYISWLLSQAWFSPDKYPDMIAEAKALGIKKKTMKKAELN